MTRDEVPAPSWARLVRLFGGLTTCAVCGGVSVHPVHPLCEAAAPARRLEEVAR